MANAPTGFTAPNLPVARQEYTRADFEQFFRVLRLYFAQIDGHNRYVDEALAGIIGGGIVTSVGLSLPASVFAISGSPVVSSGTLTGSFQTQNANLLFAGPGSAPAAAPTFRTMVLADIPNDLITYAKLQNVSAASRILGRGSAGGAGDVEELTLGSGLSLTGTVLSASVAGVVNWTEASNIASPNNVVGATSWTALSSLTNADACIVAKGTGSILAQVPDSTSTGGNKRGSNAVDLQTVRTANTHVAANAGSVIVGGGSNRAAGNQSGIVAGNSNVTSDTGAFCGGGHSNTASGVGAACVGGGGSGAGNTASNTAACVAGGTTNLANATYTFIGGGQGNTASGNSAACIAGATNLASGDYSIAHGLQSSTMGLHGAHAHSAGRFGVSEFAQRIAMVLRCTTTNNTATAMTANAAAAGTTNQLVLQNSSAYCVHGLVISRENATGDTVGWEFQAVIRRGASAAATVLVGSATVTKIATDAGASTWTLAITADTTNGALRVTFTGEAAHTIRSVCTITAVQTML